MVSFVLISWTKFAETALQTILATTMNILLLDISGKLFIFWSKRIFWLQMMWEKIELPLDHYVFLALEIESFVGVQIELNCNQFISCDTVTKKNTQICGLSVLSAVCDCDHHWILINSNVPHRKNMCNNFAESYV